MKLLEPVLNSAILFAKLFKIPGFPLAEFCVNLLFLWPQLKLHDSVKCICLVLVFF